jgi:Uma2 family endonuclease
MQLMPSAVRLPDPVTIQEFDAFVAAKANLDAYELVDGVIYLMANPTIAHDQIVANIAAPLKGATDKRQCQTFIGGMRVQRSDNPRDGDKTKPDIVVRCGPRASGTYITDPLIIVEVLSPTTMDIDRGRKLEFYKSLPTVRHIVLAYQDQMRVEHYHRSEQGFDLEVFTTPANTLTLEAIDFSVDLARVYFDVGV